MGVLDVRCSGEVASDSSLSGMERRKEGGVLIRECSLIRLNHFDFRIVHFDIGSVLGLAVAVV